MCLSSRQFPRPVYNVCVPEFDGSSSYPGSSEHELGHEGYAVGEFPDLPGNVVGEFLFAGNHLLNDFIHASNLDVDIRDVIEGILLEFVGIVVKGYNVIASFGFPSPFGESGQVSAVDVVKDDDDIFWHLGPDISEFLDVVIRDIEIEELVGPGGFGGIAEGLEYYAGLSHAGESDEAEVSVEAADGVEYLFCLSVSAKVVAHDPLFFSAELFP